MKAEAEAVLTTSYFTTEEWLEKALHSRLRNGFPSISDPKYELALLGKGLELDRLIFPAVCESVAEKIGG
jgi:hypothetical protein